jgi:hypothetical protein
VQVSVKGKRGLKAEAKKVKRVSEDYERLIKGVVGEDEDELVATRDASKDVMKEAREVFTKHIQSLACTIAPPEPSIKLDLKPQPVRQTQAFSLIKNPDKGG